MDLLEIVGKFIGEADVEESIMIIKELIETSIEFREIQRIFPLMNYSQFEQLQVIKQDGRLTSNINFKERDEVSLEQLLINNKFYPIEISSIVKTNDEGSLQLFHKNQPSKIMQMIETDNFYHFEQQHHLSQQQHLLLNPSDILENGHLLQMKQFNAFQSDCIPKIINSLANFIIVAPTSAGKTGVMSAVSLYYFNNGTQKIAYLAPLRALCQEIYETFKMTFGQINVGINTGDQQQNIDAQIMIATYEKFNNYSEKQKKQFCIIYFDEVQLIGDPNRGWIIELLQIQLQKLSIRVIGFSGSFGNAEQLSHVFKATLLSYGDIYRPVQLTKNYLILKNSTPNLYIKQQILQSELFKIVKLESKDGPVLVFVASRKKVQYLALEYQKIVNKCTVTDSLKCDSQYLKITLTKGVGFHHAGLSVNDKQLVVSLFIQNRIQVVFATTTLAQGINLPARSIIIYQPYIFTDGSISEFSQQEIVQMEGRAGRPQFGQVGNSYVLSDLKTKALDDITRLQSIEVCSNIGNHLLEFILQLLTIESMQLNEIEIIISANTFFSQQFINTQRMLYYVIQGQKMDIQLQLLVDNCVSILGKLEIVEIQNPPILNITQKGQLLVQFGITVFDYITTLSFMQILPSFDSFTNFISQLGYFSLKLSDSEILELQDLRTSFQFPILASVQGKCSFLIQVLVQPINLQQVLMQKLDLTQNINEFKEQLIRFLNFILLLIPMQSQNALLFQMINDLLFSIEYKIQLKGSFIQNYVGFELRQLLEKYWFVNNKSEPLRQSLPKNVQLLSLQEIELLFQSQELYIVSRQFSAINIEQWYLQPLNEQYYVLKLFFQQPTTNYQSEVKLCVWDCDRNKILWLNYLTYDISKLSILLNTKHTNIRINLFSMSEIFLDSLAFKFLSEANFNQADTVVPSTGLRFFHNYPFANSQENDYLIDVNQDINIQQVIKIINTKVKQTVVFKDILQFMQYQGGFLEYLLLICKQNNSTVNVFTRIPIQNYKQLCTVFEMQIVQNEFQIHVQDTSQTDRQITFQNTNFDLIQLFDKYCSNQILNSSEIFVLEHLNLESRLDIDFELIFDTLTQNGKVNIEELMEIFSNSFFLTRLQQNKQYYKYSGNLDEEGISDFVSQIIEEVIEDKGFSVDENGFLF